MATKAERFRYAAERSGAKKPKSEPRPRGRSDGTDAPHNQSVRAGKKAAYALETAAGGHPSRKSSRKAANRQKTDVQFRMKRAVEEVRPEARPRVPR
jgi:hypothetical protein